MADLRMYFYQTKNRHRRLFYDSHFVFTVSILLLLLANTVLSSLDCVNIECQHGHCANGSCVCSPGWTGSSCEHCIGRVRLTAEHGYITDGSGNYSLESKCTWLVDSGQDNVSIHIRLDQFATECGWDNLYIYDGDSVFSPLVAAYSGLLFPKMIVNSSAAELTTHSGRAYLHFYSDAAYNMSGFNMTYRIGGCFSSCANHGTCVNETCVCDAGWKGDSCKIQICPNNCSNHGWCENNKCTCLDGYKGEGCSIPDGNGFWMEADGIQPLNGRASHQTQELDGHLWVVSGYALGLRPEGVARYTISTKTWEVMETNIKIEPRYGHSMVLYKRKLYVYGGLFNGHITNEFWVLDVDSLNWTLSATSNNPSIQLSVAGHTAHALGDIMYVIFGHSPIYGYLNTVQEYNFITGEWSLPDSKGAIVKGGYGHSSVYDADTKRIYVHGGYLSGSQTMYYLSDELHSFDPVTREWWILRNSDLPRYLHPATIISGIMLVFGGNTHNDTSISFGAKCYSPEFLGYDIKCDTWHHLESAALQRDISRFGHTATVYNNQLYVYGGFNGIMLGDLLEYTPGDCGSYDNKTSCLAAIPGVKCVWEDNLGCVTKQDAITSYEEKVCRRPSDSVARCESFQSCPNCLSNNYGCRWCSDKCVYQECTKTNPPTGNTSCPREDPKECEILHNCDACSLKTYCSWSGLKCVYSKKVVSAGGNSVSVVQNTVSPQACDLPCHSHTTCENCTSSTCMWCISLQRCVETNAYVASFPYGQCREWTAKNGRCSEGCAGLHTCDDCQANPACGWCNSESNTGVGNCMDGSDEGPVTLKGATTTNQCPVDRWYFVTCPLCQCNGHSTCYNNTDQCIDCRDLTEGDNCEKCQDGYFGDPTNGRNCSPCFCNQQAETCDSSTGQCDCRTRGVIGDNCNRCDESNKYFGNATGGGTCYYILTTDYQFTFNLSKGDDQYYTQINFINIPTLSDKDVDFTINCSGHAFLNISSRSVSEPEETPIVSFVECTFYRAKFSHQKYTFGPKENHTFIVHVFDFDTPFWLQITFAQQQAIDLVSFFVTFFSCFLSLLLIAAVFWKIKQKYDMYRQTQRMFVEMEQMASRPFSTVNVEVEYSYESYIADKIELLPPDTRKRAKKPNTKPSPVALEPLSNQKAAVLSLLVQLPSGDEDFTPRGISGMAVASSIVTLGNPRKQSVEHSKGDKPKLWKHATQGHPEMCI